MHVIRSTRKVVEIHEDTPGNRMPEKSILNHRNHLSGLGFGSRISDGNQLPVGWQTLVIIDDAEHLWSQL